jgi:circadian clock protein KaiC
MTQNDGESTRRMTPRHVPTGVPGLDQILQGGLLEGASCLVTGRPGTGKTTMGNQMAFHYANEGNVLFVTVLAEAHDRMLLHLANFAFFRPELVGERVHYFSILHQLAEGGLDAALAELRRLVHSYGARLVVIDGSARFEDFAPSRAAYRRFVSVMVAQLAEFGCTTLLLAQPDGDSDTVEGIGTLVDGILQLDDQSVGRHDVRLLRVQKLRGSAPVRGQHEFAITDSGIEIYPRLEAGPLPLHPARPSRQRRLSTGVDGLDDLLRGGLLGGSSTVVAGPPGIGKTTLGLHFIAEGAYRGEPGLVASFGEAPDQLVSRATAFGLDLARHVDKGTVRMLWHPTTEFPIDAWATTLLATISSHHPRRLMIDGLTALARLSSVADRLPGFVSALGATLRAEGIASLISAETPTVEAAELDIPLPEAVATLDNVLLLRYVEPRSRLHRLISVLRVRESGFDPEVREFIITDRGIEVAPSSASAASVLEDTGRLHATPPNIGNSDLGEGGPRTSESPGDTGGG